MSRISSAYSFFADRFDSQRTVPGDIVLAKTFFRRFTGRERNKARSSPVIRISNLLNSFLEKLMSRNSVTSFAIAIVFAFSTTIQAAPLQEKKVDITVKVEVKKNDKDDIKPSGKAPFKGNRASVDVAILLDTSNSMDGLINQAKSQLWNIVQQFANAKKKGKTPILRVSVFEYGNTRLPASEGYIRQVVQLTDDLDKVSEALFSLKTSGGDEYCGMVIGEALKRLDWSKEPNSYKAIFIAGNEPFTQGSVDYRQTCTKAIQSGIIVNTIHCGRYQEGINGKWADGAKLAEGEFLNINQDRKIPRIKCPQDQIIIKLNADLNKTYLWYGSKEVRDKYYKNQIEQDSNAASGGQYDLANRAQAKISGVYRNVGRDLIDSVKADGKVLEKVKTEELPEVLQKMSGEERQAYILKLSQQRDELKKKIGKLSRERETHIVKEMKKRSGQNGGSTLGDAVTTAVQKQLKKSGFELPGDKK
jgi:hypothetical protein